MTMGEAFRTCMRKYADFSGRGRRSEYWWFYLATQLIMLPFAVLYGLAFIPVFADIARIEDRGGTASFSDVTWEPLVGSLVLMVLVSLVFFLPSLAALARRLHDMGQSGWWILLGLVGLSIVPIVMAVLDSQPYENAWGPDPKAGERPTGYPQGYAAPPPGA